MVAVTEKQNEAQNASKAPSKSRKSTVSSRSSRVKKLGIENAIKKNTLESLELKKQQKLLDLELALKLADINEESDEGESTSMHESQRHSRKLSMGIQT
ncbi:hypothetical protein JTB14_023693 [Gonioctena quinquepunctata]|nr:hypothetical protein JTB14_023693 [Gonioctena quinquepunctata]